MPQSKRSSLSDRLRISSETRLSSSPKVNTTFTESPILRHRSPGRLRRSDLSLSVGGSSSLAQAKVERWSLYERVKELEELLRDRDEIVRINLDLRDRLEQSESDRGTMFAQQEKLIEQLKRFRSKEENTVKGNAEEMRILQENLHTTTLEKDRLVRESSRLINENKIFQEELERMQESILQMIDRTVHERIVEDLRNEIVSIRKSLSETVPQSIHERLISQLAESKSLFDEKSSELIQLKDEIMKHENQLNGHRNFEANLKSKISLLEEENKSLKETIEKLQGDIGLSKTLIEDGRKYRLTAEALKESVKRSTELSMQQDRRDSLVDELQIDLENLRKIRQFETEVHEKTRLQVASLKHDMMSLRKITVDQSVAFHDSIAVVFETLMNERGMDTRDIISTIWRMLDKLGFIPNDWPCPAGVDELVHTLKTTLAQVASEVSRTATESALVQRELNRRDHELRELRMMIENLERTRGEEKRAISNLRSSMEAAEQRIGHRSPLETKSVN